MGGLAIRVGFGNGFSASGDVLTDLFHAGGVSLDQVKAGVRFKKDYQAARIGARLSFNYSPFCSASRYSAVFERSDVEEAAYTRWRRAAAAMKSPHSDVVTSAVCFDLPVPELMLPLVGVGLRRLVGWYAQQPKDAASVEKAAG